MGFMKNIEGEDSSIMWKVGIGEIINIFSQTRYKKTSSVLIDKISFYGNL
jgi:hypothetical protein